MIKHIAAIVVVLATAGYAAAGTGSAEYELRRIPMGPRPDNFVIVRVDRTPQPDRPYALTGEARAERSQVRPTPSHPKGTHGQF